MSPARMYSSARRTAALNCRSPPPTGSGSGSPPFKKREPLRQPLGPRRSWPAEIADVAAAERRQVLAPLARLGLQRCAQRFQGLRGGRERQPLRADADVAVPPERALEEERIGFRVLIEEAKDAERRQQVTGKFDGGCRASKAGSGSGSSCPHRNGCARPDQAV